MGHLKTLTIFTLISLGLSACYQYEFAGFINTDTDVEERFEQSIAFNNTSTVDTLHSNAEIYTMYAMGDSHVGETKNIDIFFSAASSNKILASLLVGDMVTGHQEDYATFVEHLPSEDSLAVFPIVGNHDLYFEGWEEFSRYWGTSTYYFIVQTPSAQDLFICLDTGSGTLGQKQLAWLKQLLEEEREQYRYCLIFTHNNIFRLRPTLSTNPMIEEVLALSDLCLTHEVNMVINGHDHQRNTDKLGNTEFIIMDALLDSNKDASYLSLSFTNETIDYEFIAIN